MKVLTVHARAIQRAAELFGEDELAVRLGASDRELRLWMLGLLQPPDRVFLEVVDMLGKYALEELTRTSSRTS